MSTATERSHLSEPVAVGRPLLERLQELPDLELVEKTIESKLNSEAPLLEEIPRYLLELGGKRIRPVIALLSAHLFAHNTPKEVIDIAAGIELIHMATLLHDDIIDHAALRRHNKSPFKKYGLAGTLLSGDFLLVRAFSMCAHLDMWVIEETERACVELTEGEILETNLYQEMHCVESSINIAKKKTAALFRLAAGAAAYLAGAESAVAAHMAEFGEKLGIAFQIVDDILDVKASQADLGKTRGTDLRERKPSLINVLWIHSGSPLARELLKPPHGDDEEFVQAALAELQNGVVIQKAQALALQHIKEALTALATVQGSASMVNAAAAHDLAAIAHYTAQRGS